MPESPNVTDAVTTRITSLIAERRPRLEALSVEIAPLLDIVSAFTATGKRLRASFLAAGALDGDAPTVSLVSLGAAVELFHAAALVHDDLIDRSDTRRGAPSTHRAFENRHAGSGWAGDGAHFGVSSALLAGDLLLMWSDDLLAEAIAPVDSGRARSVRDEFSRMREEVTAGQYLDVVEELAWPVVPVADRADRAITVAIAKSARYSVETPLVLGALLAGATPARIERIRAFGLPLGLAFQLRDDILGVFGETSVTGKPAGDDLREGKRTLLIAEAQRRSTPEESAWIDSRLGDPELTAEDITRLQDHIRRTGALDALERRVDTELSLALAVLDEETPATGRPPAADAGPGADFGPEQLATLRSLAERAARRHA